MTAPTAAHVRQAMMAKRQALSAAARERLGQCITAAVINSNFFQQAKHIACYLDVAGEAPTRALIEAIWAANKQCYLPVLATPSSQALHFAPYTPQTELKPNRYQIPEPQVSTSALYPAHQLDCAIVPLVAFDSAGHRLGMGKGYYDYSFAFNRVAPQPVPLIGLAYAFQLTPQFPVHDWDVPLTAVATEQGLQLYSR